MSLSLCTHLPLPFNICVIFQPHSRLKCNAAHYEPTTSHKSRLQILSAKIYTTAYSPSKLSLPILDMQPGFLHARIPLLVVCPYCSRYIHFFKGQVSLTKRY